MSETPTTPPEETEPEEKATIPFEQEDGSVEKKEVTHTEAIEIADEVNEGGSF